MPGDCNSVRNLIDDAPIKVILGARCGSTGPLSWDDYWPKETALTRRRTARATNEESAPECRSRPFSLDARWRDYDAMVWLVVLIAGAAVPPHRSAHGEWVGMGQSGSRTRHRGRSGPRKRIFSRTTHLRHMWNAQKMLLAQYDAEMIDYNSQVLHSLGVSDTRMVGPCPRRGDIIVCIRQCRPLWSSFWLAGNRSCATTSSRRHRRAAGQR